ncbi:thiopurine S-methyltransferase [Ancylobacter sp. VNQ12]|uniref:thiopurine S-methyltransferase n=1 Tax=Ancylobacter sp. VNQ12 TaxID=3400920 RepID=UPI003C076A63
MEQEFWHRKWQNGEIGFHEADTNPLLLRHFPELGLARGARVFVPLCGKSRDMHWLLGQGCKVTGAELSRLAVEQLFAELALTPVITEEAALERFEADGLTVFVGDFFDLDREKLGAVDGVYDRAALIALPAPMRERYAGHLAALTRHAPQLLVTLEYDSTDAVGPPFSVPEHEVRRLYGSAFHVTSLESHALKDGLKGVHPARESVWLLKAR